MTRWRLLQYAAMLIQHAWRHKCTVQYCEKTRERPSFLEDKTIWRMLCHEQSCSVAQKAQMFDLMQTRWIGVGGWPRLSGSLFSLCETSSSTSGERRWPNDSHGYLGAGTGNTSSTREWLKIEDWTEPMEDSAAPVS